MFSKTEKLESFIGQNSQFTGDVVTKGTLRVDGTLTGNVDADWLILGEKSFIKGNITVGGIMIAGKVEGNITARELIEVKSKGQVIGDISTTKLVVLEGGLIDGTIVMKQESSKKVIDLNKSLLNKEHAAH